MLIMKTVLRRNRGTVPLRSSGMLDMAAAGVLSVLFLSRLCVSAPQLPGSERSETAEGSPSAHIMINPLGAGDEQHRMLQSYLESNLKRAQLSPDLTSREQEIFFLFSLHDYDKSGQIDGLEMMKFLSDFLSYHSLGPQTTDHVVSMVDVILQTRDLNQDGMLDPSELLSPPTRPRNDQQQVPPDKKDSISHSASADPSQNHISEQQVKGAPEIEQQLQEQLQDGNQQDQVQELQPGRQELQHEELHGEQEVRLNIDEQKEMQHDLDAAWQGREAQELHAQNTDGKQEMHAQDMEGEQEVHAQDTEGEQKLHVPGMEEDQKVHAEDTEDKRQQHIAVHQGQPEI